MKELEHQLQVSCIKWFRLKYRDHLIYSIPNGGKRNGYKCEVCYSLDEFINVVTNYLKD